MSAKYISVREVGDRYFVRIRRVYLGLENVRKGEAEGRFIPMKPARSVK